MMAQHPPACYAFAVVDMHGGRIQEKLFVPISGRKWNIPLVPKVGHRDDV